MLVLKTKKENEESPATEGARRATGVAGEAAGRNEDRPDPEVSDKATRRRFSAAYKRRIVREADQCSQPGELGALLRREGLYGSNLSTWRRQHDAGVLSGRGSPKRGRKARPKDARDQRIAELERESIGDVVELVELLGLAILSTPREREKRRKRPGYRWGN